jgi:sulfate transport system permease protein
MRGCPLPRVDMPRGDRTALAAVALTTSYLGVVVLIPAVAVIIEALAGGPAALLGAVASGPDGAALLTTLAISLTVAAIDAVAGTLVAWVLVRDEFPGGRVVNALIDLPFALPTIVAGLTLIAIYGPGSPVGIHLAYTRAAVLVALLFVTLPFVVRSVQPVLAALDPDLEAAAHTLGASPLTTFRWVLAPALAPSIALGAALAFARSVGEFGALALIAGKVPVASLVVYADVEAGAPRSAAALSLVLMLLALLVLGLLRSRGARLAR